MAAPRVEDVIAFLTVRGFSAAAAALRDDLLSSRSPGDAAGDLNLDLDLDVGSALPPLRLPPPSRGGGGEDALPSAASSSSDAFLSLGSSPSGTRSQDLGLGSSYRSNLELSCDSCSLRFPGTELLNPYGVWSPVRARTDDESTDLQSEFGTAREYNSYWFDDQYGGSRNDLFFVRTDSGRLRSEDKFIMSTEGEEQLRKRNNLDFSANDHRYEHDDDGCEGCAEIYSSPFPICDCCRVSKMHDNDDVAEMIRSSSSAIYGRYQILDDQTERLDEFGEDEFQLRRVSEQTVTTVSESDLFHHKIRPEEKESPELGLPEKELQILDNNAVNASIDSTSEFLIYCLYSSFGKFNMLMTGFMHTSNHQESLFLNADCNLICNKDPKGDSYNKEVIFVNEMDEEMLQKRNYSTPFEVKAFEQGANDACGFNDCGTLDRELQDSGTAGLKGEDDISDDLHLYSTREDEVEVFDLRIIHRKNRLRTTFSFYNFGIT
ncbi:hypothetical protein B296_00057574 [Ensete ventricosum]|uniref:Uncharacterized protein n=1 Tax=Ensete ventricosum TaxID=4639 RepID=A0A426X862_ENSVE|nr:hypothetical protein B296_00057574 [Ensete ventricosum]